MRLSAAAAAAAEPKQEDKTQSYPAPTTQQHQIQNSLLFPTRLMPDHLVDAGAHEPHEKPRKLGAPPPQGHAREPPHRRDPLLPVAAVLEARLGRFYLPADVALGVHSHRFLLVV